MSATKLRDLEEMAAELLVTARKLRPGPDRIIVLREIGRFRSKIFDLQRPYQLGTACQRLQAKGR